METEKKTTAGVLCWTPAPICTSSSSSVVSAEEDDFIQMDENGIIGLTGALEDVTSGQCADDEDAQCDPAWYSGGGELSHAHIEHVSPTEASEANEQILSPCEYFTVISYA